MAAQTRGSWCLRAAPARGRRQAGERWRARETGPLRVGERKLRIVPVYRNLWCRLSDSGISGAVSHTQEDATCSTAALICIPTLPHREGWRGTAASRSVARQTLPRQRSVIPVAATSARCRATMHGTAQAFDRARTIGAAKSVSLKKTCSVRFKINYKKC